MRATAVLVGLLFLTSTAAFAAGSSSIDTPLGALLVAYTGLAVAGIGIAMFPVLKPHGHGLAAGYAALRAVECLVLLAVATYTATTDKHVQDYELLVYTLSGLGGLALSGALLRSGLVPRWLAVLGVVGYSALFAGVVCDVLGLSELESGIGLAFYVPGGLFELALPILLLVKGFARATAPMTASSHRVTR
ncbi:DUF4386 domain-containing protein [Actinokineospora diospyrosa]|uniref:DUF4386 domain-containing protein n=1 Tax=Actinokineospora diospyrosa TaxID=103728 RepID=A0ABT1IEU7_9PSEU|nr:DUF4386 domain-containing protein [Actinokineospora diospyrosa]MCP2271165.1 protein of unknown function (DUF4386) [Actinokineospora diospyrosa]